MGQNHHLQSWGTTPNFFPCLVLNSLNPLSSNRCSCVLPMAKTIISNPQFPKYKSQTVLSICQQVVSPPPCHRMPKAPGTAPRRSPTHTFVCVALSAEVPPAADSHPPPGKGPPLSRPRPWFGTTKLSFDCLNNSNSQK